MKIPIIVSGCCGKMGKAIVNAALSNPAVEIVGVVEFPNHKDLGKDIGEIIGTEKKGVSVSSSLDDVKVEKAVIIEFTSISASLDHLEWAAKKQFPMVIGTTGFSKTELTQVGEYAKKIPVLLAPNMSIGVNLLFKLVQETAKALGDDYDIEIVETHHRFKKDAPSGTALKLGQVAAEALDRNFDDVAIYGRKGITGERNPKEIAIHSLRSGDVVGEHIVSFSTIGEQIELTHKARSRDTFARGAITAAKYLWEKTPGRIFDMQDVLGFKK